MGHLSECAAQHAARQGSRGPADCRRGNRAEKIAFTLAARVVGLEPNGNLVIQGYQQTRVGKEVRYLSVAGVIRAQDITRTNTVSYEKIADARLSYVNEGDTTGEGGRKLVPRILDKVLPF